MLAHRTAPDKMPRNPPRLPRWNWFRLTHLIGLGIQETNPLTKRIDNPGTGRYFRRIQTSRDIS